MTYGKFVDRVRYTPDLDGGGRFLAPWFEVLLRGRKFDRCLEWCAGPAWIGFWLCETAICGSLATTDINTKSVEMVRNTAAANGWKVDAYEGDNLDGIPEGERFDLVVANPPNFCDIQRDHPLGFLRDDIRPSDIGWNLHREFYGKIREYLNPGGEVWLSEVAPYSREVRMGGHVYDKRPRVPVAEFREMMKAGGLVPLETIPFEESDMAMGMIRSKRAD